MKFLATLFLLSSTTAFARQMFQCSALDPQDSSVMVVNLVTADQGTVFISAGVQGDDQVLLNLQLEKKSEETSYYKILGADHEGLLTIPTSAVGAQTDSVDLQVKVSGTALDFSCFSRLYDI